MPNRPPQSRMLLPEPGTTDSDELETNPVKAFWKNGTLQLQSIILMILLRENEKNIDEMNLYKSLRNRTGPAQMHFFVPDDCFILDIVAAFHGAEYDLLITSICKKRKVEIVENSGESDSERDYQIRKNEKIQRGEATYKSSVARATHDCSR
nr:hypothetical protein [Tanacetum cinerariifolium]